MLISPKKHYHCCKKKHREHTQSYLLFASIIKQVKCGHFLSFGLGLVLNLGTLLGVRKILISDFFQTITLSLINMSVPVEGERSYKNCNIRLYLLFCVPVKTTTTNSSHCQRPTTFLSFKQTICPSVTFSSLKTSFSIWLPHLHQRQTSHNSRSKE